MDRQSRIKSSVFRQRQNKPNERDRQYSLTRVSLQKEIKMNTEEKKFGVENKYGNRREMSIRYA